MAEQKPLGQPKTSEVTQQYGVNGFAVASFILGLVAFIGGFTPVWGLFAGSIAVALGVVALKKPVLKPLSIIGIVAGGIGLLTNLLFSLALVLDITN